MDNRTAVRQLDPSVREEICTRLVKLQFFIKENMGGDCELRISRDGEILWKVMGWPPPGLASRS